MTYFENVDYEAMFGNDSGENEKDQALKEYFVDVPEFRKFFSPKNELGFVRARKGMGKSAMLKILSLRRKDENPDDIVIFTTGNELMGLHAGAQMDWSCRAITESASEWHLHWTAATGKS